MLNPMLEGLGKTHPCSAPSVFLLIVLGSAPNTPILRKKPRTGSILPRVEDESRRASLEAMQDFDWVGYILAALRQAGFTDQQDREQAAHDVVVYLLVQPGQLFSGYDAQTNGPMEGRFRIAVQNAVRNLLRTRRRQPAARAVSIGHGAGEVPAEAIPHRHRDDEVLEAFRDFLRREVGDDAVRLLDRRLDGLSLRHLAADQSFGLSGWGLRRLVQRVRKATLTFARRQGDDGFARAVERLLPTREDQAEACCW
jgi:hypothetical protein